ncbi:MAG: hypothetical protein AB2807_02270 [Candidatus Sedimenticola endophacoides]
MNHITDDQQLRALLDTLSADRQRAIGARFAHSVASLCADPRLVRLLELAIAPDLTPAERTEAFKTARSIAVASYAACGSDADCDAQAEHFVAAACTAALTPDDQINATQNPAWKAAIQARMARNCHMIGSDSADLDNEAARQYAIALEFISA